MTDTPQSWVEGAKEPHGFGLNHLPYGAFRAEGVTHLCVRIGDWLLDLAELSRFELMHELSSELRSACAEPVLNALLALGPANWATLRSVVTDVLAVSATPDVRAAAKLCLRRVAEVELVLPLHIGGYTDFYASLDHARRVGELFRPEQPLLPNYKHVPIAYNARASSIVVSGTSIQRPSGQRRPVNEEAAPEFAPTVALDYEAELAFVIGAGNKLGKPIPISRAREHLFGVTLLNDWSARDVQSWEYQPLGPFLGKSFSTSISPWITPLAALEPFRVAPTPRAQGDPEPLPYLSDEQNRADGALSIEVSAHITTPASRAAGLAPMPLGHANTRGLYWTAAQMVAHHTSNGCNLQSGDLLATGTISGAEPVSAGCLIELTRNGSEPFTLINGESRAWLADGDEVVLIARCEREGMAPLILAECRGRIL